MCIEVGLLKIRKGNGARETERSADMSFVLVYKLDNVDAHSLH